MQEKILIVYKKYLPPKNVSFDARKNTFHFSKKTPSALNDSL
jgi:hypothetical protein